MDNIVISDLDFHHNGKSWKYGPFNAAKKLQIKKDTSDNFCCLVFSLPKNCLRAGAISFGDFKSNSIGHAWMKLFCFYLDVLHTIVTDNSKGKDNGISSQGSACYMEWVPSSDTRDIVGYRFHFFCHRNSVNPSETVASTIHKNSLIKEYMKKKMNIQFQYSSSIKCIDQYATQICDVYRGDNVVSTNVDNIPPGLNGVGDFKPTSLWNHDNFKIVGAASEFNEHGNYETDEGYFTFPNLNNVYRMHMPSSLHAESLFNKYLPDYYFDRICKPIVMVKEMGISPSSTLSEDNVYLLTIKKTEMRDIYMDILNEYTLEQHNGSTKNTWKILESKYVKFVREQGANFYFYRENTNNDFPVSENGEIPNINFVSKFAQKGDGHTESNYNEQVLQVSPIIKGVLNNKYSIDEIDLLHLRQPFFKKTKENWQEAMVSEFEHRCWSEAESANMSGNATNILLWSLTNRYETTPSFESIDLSMSVFANRILRLLHWYDECLFVSNGHKALLLLMHSRFDAYRQELNLHFNQIYTGEGATSKSFLFECMKTLSILNTISELTYQTTRADAIDGDDNDSITVFNEAPPGMFMSHQKVDPAAEAMMKEKLTSQTTSCKELIRDEDTGERKNRTTYSQAIGVYMGATNDNPKNCKEAMRTRFFWGEFEKHEKSTSRSIQYKMQQQRDISKSENCNSKREQCIMYHRREHERVFLVWKYIYMGILPNPSLLAADIVYNQLQMLLKKIHKISIPPRTKERFEIICKHYVVCNALEIVFNDMNGKHACKCHDSECVMTFEEYSLQYNKCPPHEEKSDKKCTACWKVSKYNGSDKLWFLYDVLDIEPYLYCTEEIAYFALTQLEEEMYNPNEYKVKKALWSIFKNNPTYKTNPIDGTKTYDYAKFKGIKHLLMQIQNNMATSEGKMSAHNIEGILNTWMTTCVESAPYYAHGKKLNINENKSTSVEAIWKMSDDKKFQYLKKIPADTLRNWNKDSKADDSKKFPTHDPAPFEKFELRSDGFYDLPTVIEPDKKKKYILLQKEEKIIYVHMSCFDQLRYKHFSEPVTDCIKKMCHKFTRKKKILLGKCVRKEGIVQAPNMLDYIVMDKNSKTMSYMNSLYVDEVASNIHSTSGNFHLTDIQKCQRIKIKADIDILAAIDHGKKIGMIKCDADKPQFIKEYNGLSWQKIVSREEFLQQEDTLPPLKADALRKNMFYPEDLHRKDTGEVSVYDSETFDFDMSEFERPTKRYKKVI